MFEIRRAQTGDVSAATAAAGEAFAPDPLMAHFFGSSPSGVHATTMEFISILLRARLALEMPAYVHEQDGDVRGLVMGYDTSRPDWPTSFNDEWSALEARVPGLADRFAAYDALSEASQPADPHYYLGVIALHPSQQGRSAGKAMLDFYCELSRRDPKSHGVYLETGSESSLRFYLRNGFELRGEGRLGSVPLWCVYRTT